MKTTLLLTVFFTPLLGVTGSLGYEQIKVLFFILSISLIGLLWMGKGVRWTGISKAAGLFTIILLVTSLTGIDSKSSLLGREPYFQGWILYAYLYLFYLMVKTFQIEIKKYALVLTISALLVSFLAIKDWVLLNILGIQIPTYVGRVVSTFGQPNFYAGFLLLTLPFSYLLFKNSAIISQGHSLSTQGVTLNKLSYFGMISGLISVIGIFVSYSRSTILLALALLLLGLTFQLKIRFKLGFFIGVVILTSIIIALVVSSGLVGSEVSKPLVTQNPDLTKESVEKRAYIWPMAWQIVGQRPFLGYGLENIGMAFSDYFEKNKHSLFEENPKVSPVLISLKELNIDRSHNYLLDLLLFSGVIGLSGWLGLVWVLFKKLRQNVHDREQNVLLVSLIIYLVWAQFQNQSIVQLVYFWLLVGLIDRDLSIA